MQFYKNYYLILLSFLLFFFFSCIDSKKTQINKVSSFQNCTDFKYANLTIDLDVNNLYIKGKNKMYFESNCFIDTIIIDLFSDFDVDSVFLNDKKQQFNRTGNHIKFASNLQSDIQFSIDVFYRGSPVLAQNPPWEGGFVVSQDSNKLPWIGVACQNEGGQIWWPCKHDLSDEPDSMRINIIVDQPYIAVSNGKLLNSKKIQNNKTIYQWIVNNPINNYNVTINIADYANFKDTLLGLEGLLLLDYYVLKENLDTAKIHFKQVKPMLHVFEKLFGPYPFYEDGYRLVETSYLGMEHQSCISYGNKFMKGYLGNFPDKIDFDFIIIHETAHEWWGNSISMCDVKDMWIHESFATYSEALYVEALYGYDQMLQYLNYQKNKISNHEPIVNNFHQSTDMYYKGSWMLHMLRVLLKNDVKWYAILKGLQLEFRHKIVNTNDLTQYIENHYERDLNPFFKQYLFHHELPVFEYFFTEIDNEILLNYRWDAIVDDFDMPLLVNVNSQNKNEWIYPTSQWNEINLNYIDTVAFNTAESLFLIEMKKVK